MWDIPLNILLGLLAGAKLIGIFLVWRVWSTYRRGSALTPSRMLGLTGKALTDITREGRVMVQGEYWWARARAPIAQGESIRVVAIEGMQLEVEPCPDKMLVPRAVSAIADYD
ncbi:MAG: NfeD family protein [Acidobacteria bacterium]|nr:NfeD family protein [Acidobacteriota bacterium]